MQRLLKRVLLTAAIPMGATLLLAAFPVVRPLSQLKVLAQTATLDGNPFTGLAYDFFPNRRLASLVTYWRGVKHGRDLHWYANGQRAIDRSFRHGVATGLDRGWHQNGNVRYHREFKNGQVDGEFWTWHDNGQVADFVFFVEGEQRAVKSWSSFGAVHYNYVFRNNERIGVQGGGYCRNKVPSGS